MSLPCPICHSSKTTVLDTRASKGSILRRRVCVCNFRFTSLETVVHNTSSGKKIPRITLSLETPTPVKVSLAPTLNMKASP